MEWAETIPASGYDSTNEVVGKWFPEGIFVDEQVICGTVLPI